MLAALLITSLAFAKAPSSEIPAKREFPLSTTAQPCQDFHKYVCSEAENAFKLREDRSMHTFAFNDSSERILEAKKSFFKNIDKEKNLQPRDLQVKDYYDACMNTKQGVKQEKEELARLQSSFSSAKTVADLLNLNVDNIWKGEDSVFDFDIDANKDNPKAYDAIITTHLMNLPQYTYYDNKELMKDYRKLAIDFFKIAEPKAKLADIENRVDKLIAFEKGFVDVYPHPEKLRDRWSEKRDESQDSFVKKYAQLPVGGILAKIPKSLVVANYIPESLEYLNKNATAEQLPVLKDFLIFSFGHGILDDSNPAYFKKLFAFNKKYLGGPNQRPDRNERCVKSVQHAFNMELDSLLVPRLFPNFPAEKLRDVASHIKDSIKAGLNANTWLSSSAKKKAILKIETAKLYLMEPQNDKEWNWLPVKKYSSTNRIDNAILHQKTTVDKMLKDATAEVNQEAWGMGPLTVNAYYDPSVNKFVLPFGILQYPFFVADGDLIENLGAVGTVLGHELGHGLDDQGSKFDETGKLAPWLSEKELGEFKRRGARLVEYFNKAGHNGQLTLGENTADLVGVTFSHHAAFPNGEGSQADERKYFVAYARLWCYKGRPKAEELQLKTNPHSLGWARINEQVKHQPAFIKAFQCKAGDPMFLSPEQQVQIW